MRSIAKYTHIRKRATVEKVEHAIIINGSADYHQRINTDGLRSTDGADGRIKALSRNALSRLRDCIARTAHKSGNYRVYGMCLTIPWGSRDKTNPDNPTQEEASIIWREFVHHIGRLLDYLYCGILYRVELQTRGTVHWHMMVYLPIFDEPCDDPDERDLHYEQQYLHRISDLQRQHRGVRLYPSLLPKSRRKIDGQWLKRPMLDIGDAPLYNHRAISLIRAQWILANKRAYDIIAERRAGGGRCASASSAPTTRTPPAPIKTYDFCCNCIPLDGVKSGVAYLASHTTKHKQDQLGYQGKQWGILGQKHLEQPEPAILDTDTNDQAIRVAAYRLLRKWIQRNRTASDYRVCIPRRLKINDAEVYTGLVVRNTKRIYLFGTPADVVSRAYDCAIDTVARKLF